MTNVHWKGDAVREAKKDALQKEVVRVREQRLRVASMAQLAEVLRTTRPPGWSTEEECAWLDAAIQLATLVESHDWSEAVR